MKKRAVLVGRVSRGERTQDPETQLDALRATADRQGWSAEEEVSMELSAWTEKEAAKVREEVFRAIREARADVLAVWAVDRVVRGGPTSMLLFVEELENHYGVELFSYQEPFLSTATADPKTRELLLGIFAWIAEQESSRRSERLKAKNKADRARSASLGKRKRYGPDGEMANLEDVKQVLRFRAGFDPCPRERPWCRERCSIRCIAETLDLSKSQVERIVNGKVALPEGVDLHGE